MAVSEDALHEEVLLQELLASLFDEHHLAVHLLRKAGYPSERIPEFNNAASFWQTVVREVLKGIHEGGIQSLIEAARELYPENRALSEYQLPPLSAPSTEDDVYVHEHVRWVLVPIKVLGLFATVSLLGWVCGYIYQRTAHSARGDELSVPAAGNQPDARDNRVDSEASSGEDPTTNDEPRDANVGAETRPPEVDAPPHGNSGHRLRPGRNSTTPKQVPLKVRIVEDSIREIRSQCAALTRDRLLSVSYLISPEWKPVAVRLDTLPPFTRPRSEAINHCLEHAIAMALSRLRTDERPPERIDFTVEREIKRAMKSSRP